MRDEGPAQPRQIGGEDKALARESREAEVTCELLASIRIANGVARDEASNFELGLYDQERVPNIVCFFSEAQRAEAGGE